jgi:hypothetical protein
MFIDQLSQKLKSIEKSKSIRFLGVVMNKLLHIIIFKVTFWYDFIRFFGIGCHFSLLDHEEEPS